MKSPSQSIAILLLLCIIGGTGYYFRNEWRDAFFPPAACSRPLGYSLGDFDARFGLSEEEFLAMAVQAEKVWEEALGKELFELRPDGELKINLIYDYRQQATDKLSDVGVAISEDKESYDKVKASYDAFVAEYDRKKRTYERDAASYENDKREYEEKVDYWNEKGGAPKDEYEDLEDEQERLNEKAESLNRQAEELNSLSKDVNGTAAVLNDLAKKLNIKVKTFNTIGASTGEEFNEGEFMRDEEGERINVYQFEDRAKLVRLLQHEFGHALGLDHVEDKNAIMYRLNSSTNETLTEDDRNELMRACQPS